MEELTWEKRYEIYDQFGEAVIKHVRDMSLGVAISIVDDPMLNEAHRKIYKSFLDLSEEQKEAVSDLLSVTISDTIYRFLDMFEFYTKQMKLLVIDDDGSEYELKEMAEMIGEGIADEGDDGWIPKFSKVGRNVIY